MTTKRKLRMEIMPYSLHRVNIRKKMGQSKWKVFRAKVCEQSKWKCAICGADLSVTHSKLELHEKWELNEKKLTAKIERFIPLCFLCHSFKHIGRQEQLIQEGWLTKDIAVQHYIDVNKITFDDFKTDEKELSKWWLKNADKEYVFTGRDEQ